MPGVGIFGREVVMTVGGQSIAGVQTKGLTMNNEPADVTDDGSGGWRELMARPGLKTVEMPFSGILKNLELLQAFYNASGGSQIFAVTLTYPEGSVVSGNFMLASISETGESNAAKTFDSTWQSAGAIAFVPGS